MVMGWVWMVVFWGAIIGLVVWAVSRLTGENRSTNVSALDIARARYARGEIGKEEFEELRQALQ
jgi:putative membrane protein